MLTFGHLRTIFPEFSPEKEAEAMAAVTTAIDLFESKTNRLWKAREDHVQVIRTTHHSAKSVFLDLWPIEEIGTVEIAGAWVDGGLRPDLEWEELDVADFGVIDPTQNELVRLDGLNWTPYIRVTYTGGYADDEAPSDVLRAIAMQARYLTSRYDGERFLQKGQAIEGATVSYEDSKAHPYFLEVAKRLRRIA